MIRLPATKTAIASRVSLFPDDKFRVILIFYSTILISFN